MHAVPNEPVPDFEGAGTLAKLMWIHVSNSLASLLSLAEHQSPMIAKRGRSVMDTGDEEGCDEAEPLPMQALGTVQTKKTKTTHVPLDDSDEELADMTVDNATKMPKVAKVAKVAQAAKVLAKGQNKGKGKGKGQGRAKA